MIELNASDYFNLPTVSRVAFEQWYEDETGSPLVKDCVSSIEFTREEMTVHSYRRKENGQFIVPVEMDVVRLPIKKLPPRTVVEVT